MKKRIFIYTTLVLFAGLVIFFAASIYITHRNNLNIASGSLMEAAGIYAHMYNGNANELVMPDSSIRITIVSAEGIVLADSSPGLVAADENYLTRPEIIAAASGVPAIYRRYSQTHGVDFIYYALMANSADSFVFVRAAMPVAQITDYLLQTLPLFFVLLFALGVAAFFLFRGGTNRILLPLDAMVREIDDAAHTIQNSLDALRDEKTKLTYIINSIGDGLFVVDESLTITIVNMAAVKIFGASEDVAQKKLNYLVSDKNLYAMVEDCVKQHKNTLSELELGGKIYFVTVKQLPDTGLTMIALADITQARESAKQREDFFANASHELKTPLTAIRGFSELAGLNNKDENIEKFLNGISRETGRMTSLVEGMLKLSALENTTPLQPVQLSLAKVVEDVREALAVAIEEKDIEFEAIDDAVITSEPEHIYEVVKNLAENAVRYNNRGGKVKVVVESSKKITRITISDTGIGISPGEHEKIFERFYRVEKSRAVKSGGTGLGLAIVKHTCALYGWKLELRSKLGVGTEVTVVLSY